MTFSLQRSTTKLNNDIYGDFWSLFYLWGGQHRGLSLSVPNTFQTFIKQVTIVAAENNGCLYFTQLFQGQRDIPQFTGQHTSYPQSGVTVLLNPEKTAAAYPHARHRNTLYHLVSLLWHRQIMCNCMCLKTVEENVNQRKTLNMGNKLSAVQKISTSGIVVVPLIAKQERRMELQDASCTYFWEKNANAAACSISPSCLGLERWLESLNALLAWFP